MRVAYDTKTNGLLIFYVCVFESQRNQGIFRNFLNHLIDKNEFDEIVVLGVESQVLHDYLQRFQRPNDKQKFRSQGGDFIWNRHL